MADLKNPALSKQQATIFADKWKTFTDEKQHARGFWSEFFRTLCGVDDEEIAGIEYEKRVKSTLSGNQEYIDVYWKNVALIEHKSTGENLDKAELQARGYLKSLPPGYRPRTIIISDFANFRVIDEKLNRTHQFTLAELPNNIHRFESIISGSRPQALEEEITVDQVAAKLMANLYLELESHGFEGHETSVFLIRILFLMFGDDTGMWEKNLVKSLILETKNDGSDIGKKLNHLFKILNTPTDEREKTLDEKLGKFPYVNGGIFSEDIAEIEFNRKMRVALIDVANYDWASINPTIFGALFQLIKSKDARRELGEHYTSEENINKLIYPLFLDDLQERLANAWDNKKLLKELRKDLGKLKIFDPACGCGNFLVVSYRHLRQLELELTVRLQHLEGKDSDLGLDGTFGLAVGLHQFYGIELEEWPAQVAKMALFLTDHQENLKLERITGYVPNRFPLKDSAQIFNSNALLTEWRDLISIDASTYILGNPPFSGSTWQSRSQKSETAMLWKGISGSGLLDYVTNWLLIAGQNISKTSCQAAFVSTSSISQGTQPAIIWSALSSLKIEISFAHRSFDWSNDTSDQAGVHCIIIGLRMRGSLKEKFLTSYSYNGLEGNTRKVENINAYLLAAPDILIKPRKVPLFSTTRIMDSGCKPADDGYLSKLSIEEVELIQKSDQIASKYLRRIVGARELIHDDYRYCLWLLGVEPSEIRASKELSRRVAAVKAFRKASNKAQTRKDSDRPSEFQEIRQPKSDFLAIPVITSGDRDYIPMMYLKKDVVINNKVHYIENCELDLFAFLNSSAFNIWNKAISGRTRNDTALSNTLTYNNFPFPVLSEGEKAELIAGAQGIIAARESFPNSSLADLYGDASMPKALKDAHGKVNAAVLRLLGLPVTSDDEATLSMLFKRYLEYENIGKL